jgi:hypothetical protein
VRQINFLNIRHSESCILPPSLDPSNETQYMLFGKSDCSALNTYVSIINRLLCYRICNTVAVETSGGPEHS